MIEKWRYTEGPEWPYAKGMSIRLANGNTLGNYGTGGTIREIAPDKRTVFHVKFDTPDPTISSTGWWDTTWSSMTRTR